MNQGAARIMLVEDDPLFADVVKRALREVYLLLKSKIAMPATE